MIIRNISSMHTTIISQTETFRVSEFQFVVQELRIPKTST